ncbi:MAG: single-stranded-DNA-specific exonuclease RecJ [Acidaminococcaceae bacterium]|jgi:single-stranded-DNA-specific exonuclease|nr:single-stranded-DNA-specific exonuclease RecJ [Acidaminococcaceae bacterium]
MHKRRILPAKNIAQDRLEALAKKIKVAPLILGVLLGRGITEEKQIKDFLYGSETPYHDPFLLQDMSEATERILHALELGETITVYGDYDVDGITASSVLYLFLKEQGAHVNVYIPKRDGEGYGLNTPALQTLAEQGTTLVITVDSGISGAREVAQKPAQMDIIITDHHMPPAELPKAFAVINPHREGDSYPFKDLAGVGVSFKLCQALYQKITKSTDMWLENLDLVALGTIADMVPLMGENRELVRAGLKVLTSTKNKGIVALIESSGLTGKPITGGTVGFTLAPRLNAVGRLDDAMAGVKLLTCDNVGQAKDLAKMLNEENITRQGISQKIFEEADAMLQQGPKQEWGIVLFKEDWHSGVIGIAASRLVEKYDLPVILLTKDGDKAKGSCRSIPPLNLYEALAGCKEFLMQFGGHKQAAGLTLSLDKIELFRKAFQQMVKKMLEGKIYVPEIRPDYYFPAKQEITIQAVKDLSLLEPCGMGNPSAVFAFANAKLLSANLIGKEHEHLRLNIANGNYQYTGLLWHEGANLPCFYTGEEGAWAFAPRLNYFMGKESVNLQIMALEPQRNITDYRGISKNKEEVLKSILQNGKKTVVYLGKTTKFSENMSTGQATLINPHESGYNLPDDTEQVVLYDIAGAGLLAKQEFFLAGKPNVNLYLCYENSEIDMAKTELTAQYPTADGLRFCYKFLHDKMVNNALAQTEVLGKVLPQGPVISKQVLAVFQELGFIKCDQGVLTLVSTQRNELSNSATYKRMQETYTEKLSLYNKIKNITCDEIAALWR